MQDMAEDVQVLPIARPAPTAQDAGTVVAVEPVGFAEVDLPEEAHHRVVPVKKVRLENTNLLILINPQKQNPVNHQKYLLMKLISILIPTTDTLQEYKQQIFTRNHP